jgi:hypothetical protein
MGFMMSRACLSFISMLYCGYILFYIFWEEIILQRDEYELITIAMNGVELGFLLWFALEMFLRFSAHGFQGLYVMTVVIIVFNFVLSISDIFNTLDSKPPYKFRGVIRGARAVMISTRIAQISWCTTTPKEEKEKQLLWRDQLVYPEKSELVQNADRIAKLLVCLKKNTELSCQKEIEWSLKILTNLSKAGSPNFENGAAYDAGASSFHHSTQNDNDDDLETNTKKPLLNKDPAKSQNGMVQNEGLRSSQGSLSGKMKRDQVEATLYLLPLGKYEQQFSEKEFSPSQFKSDFELTTEAREVLKKDESLDFEIFTLRTVTNNDEVTVMLVNLYDKHDLFESLNIRRNNFIRLARRLQAGYNDNLYHNQTHAADVTQVGPNLILFLAPAGLRILLGQSKTQRKGRDLQT